MYICAIYACMYTCPISCIRAHQQDILLLRHKGPVWEVAWAHPKFGNILASCSYDRTVGWAFLKMMEVRSCALDILQEKERGDIRLFSFQSNHLPFSSAPSPYRCSYGRRAHQECGSPSTSMLSMNHPVSLTLSLSLFPTYLWLSFLYHSFSSALSFLVYSEFHCMGTTRM